MILNGKRVLITGATGGIGQQLSMLLEQKGATLLLNCINASTMEQMIRAMADRHEKVIADISSEAGRATVVEAADSFAADVVINLAGILDFNWYEDQSVTLINQLLQVNLVGPMLLCRDLLPQLHKRKKAVVLNVGSTFGSIGHPGFVAYCASKAGIKGFSEALGRELADTSVHVQYIAPRATATALNSNKVNDMNAELGNKSDSPTVVAAQIVALLESGKTNKFLGWPEKLFVKINGLMPSAVHKALVGKLSIIKRYAKLEVNKI